MKDCLITNVQIWQVQCLFVFLSNYTFLYPERQNETHDLYKVVMFLFINMRNYTAWLTLRNIMMFLLNSFISELHQTFSNTKVDYSQSKRTRRHTHTHTQAHTHLYMCVFTCMHTWIQTYILTHTFIYVYDVCLWIHEYMNLKFKISLGYIHTYIHTALPPYIFVCVCVCVCVNECACVCESNFVRFK